MEYAVAFIVGLILGSFYNVLIYRLPRNVSVVFPSSHCPHCKHRIRWYDNIPLISYVILRGKCRHCGAEISWQYPLVELASGLLAVVSILEWGLSLDALFLYFFFSALMVASLIDLKFFILPDVITLPGIVVGLGASFLRENLAPTESLLGGLVGFLIPLLIYLYYVKVRHMEGLGFGDVKLLAMVGTFTGIYGVISALFLGSLFGLIFALPSIIKSRNTQFVIPFGPFLSLGCFVGALLEEWVSPYFAIL